MSTETYDIATSAATLAEVLARRAAEHADRPAYTFLADGERGSESLTYGELEERVSAVAAGLSAALATADAAGGRVLLLYPPGLDFVVAFLACLRAGAVAVPSYPPRLRRPQPRLSSIAGDCSPALVAAPQSLAEHAAELVTQVPELAGVPWLATDCAAAVDGWQAPPVAAGDLAMLQYTSGSTAEPKGVMVRHGHLMHNQEMIRRAFDQSPASVVVSWLPLYHDMGLIGGVLQPLYAGGRCILMSPLSFLQRPRRWLEAVSRWRATTSGGPNFAYDLTVRKAADDLDGLDLSSWRVAFNGAEPVRAETLSRFAAAFAPAGFAERAFFPCYGLAEATLFVTGGTVDAAPARREVSAESLADGRAEVAPAGSGRSLVSCGAPSLGQRVRVVDPAGGAPRDDGQVGEIWISGRSVTAGYWGRPEQTRRDFAATQADDVAATWLRTGDLGFLADGQLYVTGRVKELLILRGRNHYPQDLERSAERAHPALRAGGAAAFSVPVEGEERAVLVAEVSRHFRGSVDALGRAVTAAVAEEHGVGLYELVLLRHGTLPKTTSGKTRRRACRDAYLGVDGGEELAVVARTGPSLAASDVAEEELTPSRDSLLPLSGDERREILAARLALLAARATGAAETPPLDAPLSSLGLDSLAAVELQRTLLAELGIEVSLERLLAGPPLAELAAELATRLDEPAAAAPPLLAAGPVDEPFPLTAGQQALWFLHRLAPDSAAYNLAAAGRLRGAVDADALERALAGLVRRHPALGARFSMRGGEPVQRHGVEVPVLRRDKATGRSLAEIEERLAAEAFRPFDLLAGDADGAVLRVVLYSRADDDHLLLLTVHHAVADFASLETAARDLGLLYAVETAAGDDARAAAVAALPPAPAVTYRDFAAWLDARLAGGEGEAAWQHWRGALAGAPTQLDLPTDRPRPALQTYRGGACSTRLPAAVAAAAGALARRRGATTYAVLLAALQSVLARLSGQDDLLVGSPLSLRAAPELDELVGYLVNPLPLRGELADDPSFADLVERTGGAVAAALEHRAFPFPWLAERLQPQRDGARPPLFQVMYVHQRERRGGDGALAALAVGAGGVELDLVPSASAAPFAFETVALEPRAAAFELTLTTAELAGDAQGGGLAASLVYNADLFDAATAERHLQRLAALLAAALEDPSRRLSELPLLSADEERQILAEWADGGALATEPDATLHGAFLRQAAATPEATALVVGEERYTYGELEARSAALARRLVAAGVGREERVGVLLPRRAELVVALLAVLRAGGAYVPLDPAYPRQRLRFMLEDSAARVLVTGGGDGAATTVPDLDELGVEIRVDPFVDSGEAGDLPLPIVDAGGLAYVIYTSGSTGRPKGVSIEHRQAAAMVAWAGDAFPAADFAGVLAATSVCFDLSVFEIFAPLAAGGTVVLADDALALPRLPARDEVTLVNTVPSALAELLRGAGLPPAVRTVNLAGEALPGALVRGVHAAGEARVVNLYGPSEDTTYSTWGEVPRDAAGEPTIGRPVAGGRAYVLDRRGAPLPAGVPGELYLGGAGVTRGYLGRPALTAARWLPDPFADAATASAGGRLYRTGDLVRWRGDGELEFLGRLDHQVKVRGFRIELGEVEAVLLDHPRVRENAVVASRGPDGVPRLVAYFAVEDGTTAAAPEPAELRRWVAGRLPEHAVPSLWVAVAALPRTPNGKLDRGALPEPGEAARTVADETPPRTPLEEVLAAIWADLFDLPRVGVHSNFFDLGGHSLLATRLLARVHDAAAVELPLATLFETPTLAGLAAAVEEARRAAVEGGEAERPAPPPLVRAAAGGPPPLSFAQERLWFLDQLEPGLSVYNVPGALRWRQPLCLAALHDAFREVVRRHETLRTTVSTVDERPLQIIHPPDRGALPVVDLGGLTAADRETEGRRLANREARRAFDLAAGPLLRTRALRLAEDDHAVLATLHHIASDGWSLGVLAGEVGELYAAFAAGRPSPLAELPLRYADFAQWQRQWLAGPVLEDQLAFWRRSLEGAPPVLELPTDRPRPPVQSFRGAAVRVGLPADLTAALRHLARRRGATLFMTLLAAFKVLLARHSGQRDLLVGTPLANRGRSEIEGLIGFFVNTLVVRSQLADDPAFTELLSRVRAAVLEVHAHQDLPLEKLVEELQLERDLSRTPLFQVVFALQTRALGPLDLPGVPLDFEHVSTGTSKFDLMLDLSEGDERVEGYLEYASDLFDAATARRLARQLRVLLEGVVAAPDGRVGELPLLAAAERHQLLVESNDTAPPAAEAVPVHRRFEAAARRSPQTVAVATEAGSLTYGEVDAAADRLARRLAALGVGPEVPVALCLERVLGLIVAMLGILKAGGAYVPLDPGYPADRSAYMLDDCGAPVLVSDAAHGARLLAAMEGDGAAEAADEAEDGAVDEGADDVEAVAVAPPLHLVRVDAFGALQDEASGESEAAATALPVGADGEAGHLAYVIYTSGSTGRPKGVAVEHRQLASYVDAAGERLGLAALDAGAGFATVSTFAADLGHTCVFPALTGGGTLHLVGEERASDPQALGELFAAAGVDVLKLVPSHLEALLDAPRPAAVLPRRALVLGGEAWSPQLVARLAAAAPDCAVFNHYGPSETTVGVIARRVDPRRVVGSPPLGRPMAGRSAHLLGRSFEPVPLGVTGELYLGGDGVARGYAGRPRLTAERFVPDPFSRRPGGRLYRTGDVARRRTDGELVFVGRADDQVKYHGYRIEPNEIRLALNQHPKVRDSRIVLRRDGDGRDALVAYYVARAEIDPEELRTSLAQRVIEETVPNVFVHLRKLPLTLNGKVNLDALPSLDDLRLRTRREHVAPRTPTEEGLAAIWSEVLGVVEPSVHDNFFQLGGHSLLATRVISRLRQSFAVDLPLRLLFERPTIARLAVAVTEAQMAQEDRDEMARMLAELSDLSGDELRQALEEEVGAGGDGETG